MARVAKSKQKTPPETQTKRAVIYTRVSTSAQDADDKISLSEQEADCRAYCESKGYEVATVYTDVKSGATSKRPDFLRMIAAATEGAFDVVVCWKVDRLGRGLFPMARLLEALEPNGITIEAVKEQVDQRYLGLFASVGKIELDNIRERTMHARLAYARQGKMPNGQVRYGYRCVNGEPVIDEQESAVLLEAARRYVAGESIAEISLDFHMRGVPTRKPDRILHGQGWKYQYLRKLIYDEAYFTGQRPYGTEFVKYPPLYSADLWEGIQRVRAGKKKWNPRNTQHEYLCQHLLYCRECKLACITNAHSNYSRVTGQLTSTRLYYKCGGMQDYPAQHHCRPGVNIRARDVDAAVWGAITKALRRPETLLEAVQAKLNALEASAGDSADDADAERQLALLKAESLEIARQRIKGKIDDARLDVLEAENEAQTAYWLQRADAHRRLQEGLDAQRRTLEEATAHIRRLSMSVAGRLEELTFAERRALLAAVADRIWIDGENRLTIEGILEEGDDTTLSAHVSSRVPGEIGISVVQRRPYPTGGGTAAHRRCGDRLPTS
ncbi:MAG TPA: recombinase family protein [Chloroflexota bacterium]|nr:recombinase family protein [Chloroflexota bacterium]